jgi:tyrosyl-tRNA synthetase
MITFIPIEEIEEMTKWPDNRINEKKEILAFEITKLVHGEEEAQKALQAARALFSGEGDDANMPTTELNKDEIGEGMGLLDLLVLTKLAASKGEARRLIDQGGISINGEKVNDSTLRLKIEDFSDGIKIKKGKKAFHKVIIK